MAEGLMARTDLDLAAGRIPGYVYGSDAILPGLLSGRLFSPSQTLRAGLLDPLIPVRSPFLDVDETSDDARLELTTPKAALSAYQGVMAPINVMRGQLSPREGANRMMPLIGVGGLLGRGPSGALGSNMVRRMADDSGADRVDGLMQVLRGRAAQMELDTKQRIEPRPDRPDIIPAGIKDYQKKPLKFNQDVAALAPRRTDDKPYPLNDRIRPLIDRKEEIAQKLAERSASQKGKPTQFFYNTGPIFEAAQKVGGLSKKEAREWMRDFAQSYGATSPRTVTDQNLRNATLAMAKESRGIPVREIVGKGTGGISEKGYPMMTGQSGIHGILLDARRSGGLETRRDTNPKPATFADNVEGNLSGVTIDTHAIRGALDALNEIDPGSIPKEWIKPKFRKQYAEDPSSLNPATMIDDTLKSVTIDGVKKQVEYGPIADIYAAMGKKLDVSPAEAQSMGWFGSGDRTGLMSEAKTIVDLLNDRIDVTAQLLGISNKEAARKLFRREIPLASNPMGGLLMQGPGSGTGSDDFI